MTLVEFYETEGEKLYERFRLCEKISPNHDIMHRELFRIAMRESYSAASDQLQERKAG